MTKADDVLRKCMSGKKLNVDKWSKNKIDYCNKHNRKKTLSIHWGAYECPECSAKEAPRFKKEMNKIDKYLESDEYNEVTK